MSQPNIIWLTVDSIRTDRCSTFGHSRQTTPRLDEICEAGHGFSDCFSHGIWSLPSASSIMTGKYPSYHRTGGENDRLPQRVKTIPEAFSTAGYRTIGVSANPWFSEATGLNRGFDDFEYLEKSNVRAAGITRLAKYVLSLNRHSGGYTLDMAKNRSEYLSLGLVRSKLKTAAVQSDPFFLYAHTEGAHTPYYPPKKSLDQFADDLDLSKTEARERVYEIHQNLYREIAQGLEYDSETWNALEVMYDSLIHYIDSQIGAVYDTIQELDLGETIFIITSDHGDLLGEHGFLSHKVSLHDGLLNVPLIVHGRDVEADTTDLTQHTDMMKTIMAWCDLDNDFVEGINIETNNRDFVLSQRSEGHFWKTMDQILQHNPDFDTSRYHEGFTSALRTKEHKLVHSPDKIELFNLPDESDSATVESPEIVKNLENTLESEIERFGSVKETSAQAEFTGEMKDRLRDLGYV